MSQFETIARPYARAAFKQASEANLKSQWGSFLNIAATIISDVSVKERLQAPGFFIDLISWVEQYLNEHSQKTLSEQEKNFLLLLKENDRLNVLPQIAEEYATLLNDENGCLQATVYTAKKLDEAQKALIEKLLEKKTAKAVVLQVIEQPDLLAGVRIEYDGLVIDQSTKGRITEFARKLDDLRN